MKVTSVGTTDFGVLALRVSTGVTVGDLYDCAKGLVREFEYERVKFIGRVILESK